MTHDVSAFMANAAPPSLSGSSPWAARYAATAKLVVREYAETRPRSLQKRIGPSGFGHPCDRSVVWQVLDLPATNHVVDCWPSFAGTALHAEEANAFDLWNLRHGVLRFVTETKVDVDDYLRGTADLYDAEEQAVVDHKNLGATTLAKLRTQGPSDNYLLQLLAYGRGYRLLGLPVKRVAIIAWPRTGSSLDGVYVWDRPYSAADDELLDGALARMKTRLMMADLVRLGRLRIDQVPASPSDDDCYFCPAYRPESAKDGGPGCPGARLHPAQ